MKCHCHLHEQLSKFKAGKLGLLGGVLIIGHLLFHVAECLVIPALLMAMNRQDAEAIEQLTISEIQQTTYEHFFPDFRNHHLTFREALENSRPRNL